VTPFGITVVLTVLSAVVIVLTRVRLSRDQGTAGRLSISAWVVNLHTLSGVPALGLWVVFLVTKRAPLGWSGIALWWVTVLAGLLVLARWIPARGRHSSEPSTDTWGEGPGLSILAHGGLLVGVVLYTTFMALGKLG
jgi:hypothetical protein